MRKETGARLTSKAGMYMTSTVFEETPDLAIEDTAYGFQYAAPAMPVNKNGDPAWSIRITPVMFPTGRIIYAFRSIFSKYP